jgi:hypothetical protein
MSNARSLVASSALSLLAAVASCSGSQGSPPSGDDAGPPGDDAGSFGDGHDCTHGPDFTGCPCQLGETKVCYTGPTGTQGVGTCKDGTQTCALVGENDHVFGACTGEVLPTAPRCDGLDHACNHQPGAACDGGQPPPPPPDGGQPPVDGGNCVASIAAPRLVAPLSTAHATSTVPKMSWRLAAQSDGARVQVCKDKACNQVIATFDGLSSGAPASPLPAGVVYWRAFGKYQGSVGCTAGPTWELFVTHLGTPVNSSWGSVLDVDEDGYADAIVSGSGAFFWQQPADDAGTEQVDVFLGSSGGLGSSPALSLTGPNRGFGVVVADAGDTNGDGYADVVVGTWETKTHLFLGGPSGLGSTPAVSLPYGGQAGAQGGSGAPGYLLAGAGDTNGDGYADVALGVPDADRVYVFLGGPSGLAMTPSSTLTGAAAGLAGGSVFGINVANAGDVNGDGYADLIVGASPSGNPMSLELRRAYVYYGGPGGLQDPPSAVPTVPVAPTFWQGVGGAGDVNGDGYTDVLVNGAPPNAQSGIDASVFVFMGSNAGLGSAPATALTLLSVTTTWYGTSHAAADLNGDGYWDVAVGASWSGAAYVYPGGPSGSSTTAMPVIATGMVDFAGGMGAADTNGDGYDDLGISDGSNMRAYLGSSMGVATSPSVTCLAGMAYSGFHAALASP